MRPDVSVIIPTKGRRDLLKQVLGGLRKHVSARHALEIIVVDTGDGSEAHWASRRGHRGLYRPGASFAAANNAAAAEADAHVLWLLNNDVILTGDPLRAWFATGLPTCEVMGARLLYPSGLVQHAGVGFDTDGNPYHLWHNGPGEHPAAMTARYLHAVTFACALVGRAIWRELGGLDERYVNAYEDVDFCLKAREAGYQVRYVPEATAVHLGAQTPGRFDKNAESLEHYRDVWLRSGRFYYVSGVWPFSFGG